MAFNGFTRPQPEQVPPFQVTLAWMDVAGEEKQQKACSGCKKE
jgi:hypothetical protein